MIKYEVYTDGATSKNGQSGAKGGYAFIVLKDGKMVGGGQGTSASWEVATNQRMELWAAIGGCNNIVGKLDEDSAEAWIYSDSAYLVNCYSQGWWRKWVKNGWINSKKEPVKNRDLWERLIPFFENKKIHFVKVKGHTGEQDYNAVVDKLAVSASKRWK